MIAELRTYTANRGMLDTLLATLNGAVFPNHAAFGIRVIGLWADRQRNEACWIRVFDSVGDRQARLAAYESSEARLATVPKIGACIARPPEARILDDAFAPGAAPSRP